MCAATSLNLAFKHIDDLARVIRTETLYVAECNQVGGKYCFVC